MKHVDIRITGTVQGVFFRVSTQRKARELGVAGTVRNELDGSVTVEAEADESTLTRFTDWCRVGPANESVHRVQVPEWEPRSYEGFTIAG